MKSQKFDLLNRNAMVDDYTNITSIGIPCRFFRKTTEKRGLRENLVYKLNISDHGLG